MTGYTPRQLVSYYRYCTANPDGRVLPPGCQAGWDDMSARDWLTWFRACLMQKIASHDPRPYVRADDPQTVSRLFCLAHKLRNRITIRPWDVRGIPEKYSARLAHRVTHPWEE